MGPAEFEKALEDGLGSWPRGTAFLAAVSGGADSTAMLSALASLVERRGYKFRCLHVNHGIRPAGDCSGDAEFVRSLCRNFKIPCTIAAVPQGRIAARAEKTGAGIEDAARYYRRRAWERELRRTGAAKVLVAHTRDDALETLIMAVIRGAGPAGLSWMPRQRGNVLRPMISLTRVDVLGYLKDRNISYRTDATNSDTRYFRNRIRHTLIPLLDEQFPGWKTGAASLGKTQRLVSSYLVREAAERIQWKTDGNSLTVPEELFFGRPGILREEAVFQGINRAKRLGGKAALRADPPAAEKVPRRKVLRSFVRGNLSALDLGSCRLTRTHGTVRIEPAVSGSDSGFSLAIDREGTYTAGGLTVTVVSPESMEKPSPASAGYWFYAGLPLIFRCREPGDRIQTSGKNKLLKDLLPAKEAPGNRRFIVAEDYKGIIVCIGLAQGDAKILLCRENCCDSNRPPPEGDRLVYIGGFDA
ncbi:tRNA lysidine(34) synthetase TilS [Breznakiella homolactica]|uniref:tRNA(Ile)-lysidine synthase n=1 Tax=Breznakiella homolactica TaxID=2798577 RepID=A0A7T7XRF7_9SPIR|nr:tRNA lysidine(34) synthetase TilS [Breznakiella homolactica]QQO11144.1 tRNA lysidine(34) synthetase TilS [Breznakiella homolactica]